MTRDKPTRQAKEVVAVAEAMAYIMAAQQALSEARRDIRRSMKCPSCDKLIGRADGNHILYMGFVVVSCKGYWTVDPNKLGFERPQWTPAKSESLTRGHGSMRSWKETSAAT